MASEFEELRQQACQLTADIEMASELPRVERSLYQLRDMALKMASKAPVEGTDMKASLLLGSRGYDVSKASEKLQSLSSLSTFEPLEPIQDVNVQAFLKNEYENALLAAVEQTRRNMFEEASALSWRCGEVEWQKQKHKILSTLCDFTDVVTSGTSEKSLNDTLLYNNNYHRLSTTSQHHQAYDDVISKYNKMLMEGGRQESLVSMFKQVAQKFDDQACLEVWTLMSYLVEAETRGARLVRQALTYLERSYLLFIERMVSCNLHEARLGGVPSRLQLVVAYFNARRNTPFRGAEDGLLEGHPVWAVLYQCLRCGDPEAIERGVEKSRKLIGDFADVIKQYKESPGRRLPPSIQREVKLRYKRTVCNSADPFKRLVYCLLGRCDPQDDHSEVATTTDDYMWLKLSMVDEEEADASSSSSGGGAGGSSGGHGGSSRSLNKSFEAPTTTSDKLSFSQLQSLLLEGYGEAHFNAHQHPLLYSKILLLIGQFEACVEFLFRFEAHRHLAVHVACVFLSQNMLLLPAHHHAHLLSRSATDAPLTRRLNVVHLIVTFTSTFESHDPLKALHYYYLLRGIRADDDDEADDTDMFVQNFCQLTISTRDYDLMLGRIQTDGSRKAGLLDQFNVSPDKVIERVAGEVEAQGHVLDAVRLYDLAKNEGKVLELLTQLLSQVVALPSSKPRVEQVKKIAFEFASRSSSRLPPSPSLTSFHLLIDLSSFFQAYHASNFQEAYNIIRELNLVSLSSSTLDTTMRRWQKECQEVRRCLPEMLLATAHCLSQLCKQLTNANLSHSTSADQASRNNLLKEYRAQMASLVSFSGSMTSRMPSHVTAQLVSLEASIK